MNEKMQKLSEKIKASRLYKAFPEQLRKTKLVTDTDINEETAIADSEAQDEV